MQNLTVRKAVPADIPDILRITRSAFEQYRVLLGLPLPPAALTETEEDIARDIATKDVRIGFFNGLVAIGCVRCETLPGNVAYISRFSVSPNWQSSGMGHALLEAVEQDCRERGVAALTLHTATRMFALARFYYGQGFFVHSTTDNRGYIRGLFVKEILPGAHYSLEEAMKR
jgi:ribosomal protein S18 acetylase RimI-like enzyme